MPWSDADLLVMPADDDVLAGECSDNTCDMSNGNSLSLIFALISKPLAAASGVTVSTGRALSAWSSRQGSRRAGERDSGQGVRLRRPLSDKCGSFTSSGFSRVE